MKIDENIPLAELAFGNSEPLWSEIWLCKKCHKMFGRVALLDHIIEDYVPAIRWGGYFESWFNQYVELLPPHLDREPPHLRVRP